MARVKLNQPVNVNGIITTCAELLDSGNAIVDKSNSWYSKRSEHLVTKYLVRLLGKDGLPTSSCFEIGQKAYESRKAIGQHIAPVKTQEQPSQTQETPITLNGTWDTESQSYIAEVNPHDLSAIKVQYEVFAVEPTMNGTGRYTVNYLPLTEPN